MNFPLTEFPTLEGQRVRLLPLEATHINDLWQVGDNGDIWTYFSTPLPTLEKMSAWVMAAIAERERGTSIPFVIYDKESGRLVGATRFFDIEWPHKGAEIGSTWLTPSVWRTVINTECKLLLLGYAFETLGLIRVQFRTDARNIRSQKAIERLGAQKEGVLRSHRILPDGFIRDSVVYSIIEREWPEVKAGLEGFLGINLGV